MRGSLFYKFFSSPYFILAEIILLGMIGVSLAKEFVRRAEILRQIKKLKLELSGLEGENRKLRKMIDFTNSESFLEEEARQRLGLAKPGEKVLVLVREGLEQNQNKNAVAGVTEQEKKIKEKYKNLISWWNYFFGY